MLLDLLFAMLLVFSVVSPLPLVAPLDSSSLELPRSHQQLLRHALTLSLAVPNSQRCARPWSRCCAPSSELLVDRVSPRP
jgi:hypothetical protein